MREPTFLSRRHGANMSAGRDARFRALLEDLRARYREQVRVRDGRVPGPPWSYRARELLARPARAALGAVRR